MSEGCNIEWQIVRQIFPQFPAFPMVVIADWFAQVSPAIKYMSSIHVIMNYDYFIESKEIAESKHNKTMAMVFSKKGSETCNIIYLSKVW